VSDPFMRLQPLFYPRGVIFTGVSQHPGKFGTVALHNLLRCGFKGEVFPLQREGVEIFGLPSYRSVAEIPPGRADLAFLCTPAAANEELLRECARAGVRAAFVASAGYGEAGPEGRAAQASLVALADSLGIALAGPNGQGLISTSVSLCAQFVAPYPPAGAISVASQSGNLASVFMNYGSLAGIGFSKVISCGNGAQLGVADFLEYFARDPETAVSLAYLESAPDLDHFERAAREHCARKPLVLLRGGASAAGQRAAARHTGAVPLDEPRFARLCSELGIALAQSAEEAYETAASFASQPLPRGARTLILTAAGGWGVLSADACVQAGLDLVELPPDLATEIDRRVPTRWSRSNPVDLAGGEVRDTIPELLELAAAHPAIDAVLYLGLGLQAAQAELFRSGRFYPEHGLERISDFHIRQDRRYALAAAEVSQRHGKPVLCASDLVYTDRAYGNAGPLAARETGRLCYPSGPRAAHALAHLVRYAQRLRPRE
jgi:acyl-CoA synthetase (NDP forming)